MDSSTGRVTWDRGDSDDEELHNSVAYRNSGKVALLLVIDSTPDMFRPWADNEHTPFRAALQCCISLWRSKIISSPHDLVGILLTGTEKEKNSPGFPYLYLLQTLSKIKVSMIEELSRMIRSEDLDGFEDRIGSSANYNLKDLFWLSKILYEDAKAGTFAKKLMYFTCEDNPHAGNRNLRNDSIQKFRDLGPLDFSVVTFRTDFQYAHFYQNLLADESGITFPKDLKSLMVIIRVKERAKRPMCRSTLQLTPGVSVAVGVYSLARTAVPPKQIHVNERSNELVTKSINSFRADTGATVLKSEQVRVATLFGETVRFQKDELAAVKGFVGTGITVLGYLSRGAFDEFCCFRAPGYFIYPDEERVTGSTDLFSTLLRRCHALERVPVVKMVLTRGRSAKLGCLIPSLEGTGTSTSGSSVTRNTPPCGFHLFQIPFSDEMCAPELVTGRAASEEMIELMEKIIRKTSNKNFDLQVVENPSLQHKWRQIERLALNQGEGDGFVDDEFANHTEPNDEVMHARVGSICKTLNEAVASAGVVQMQLPTSKAKQPINMAMEAKNKRVEKLTRAVIVDFLESRNISTVKMLKGKVVEMVYAHFANGGS